ncbi:arabinose-proton symporter [Drosophila grimshawi]|uniref:GH16562 n=1 Tax=Drosophila grimshawi TaxID=7222 RepID=B4J1N3_DROGR|nr:arabinose-proton symporter [Drosophila grimshawi]EDV96953.1 GH16562 [Drosophila grimshawi]
MEKDKYLLSKPTAYCFASAPPETSQPSVSQQEYSQYGYLQQEYPQQPNPTLSYSPQQQYNIPLPPPKYEPPPSHAPPHNTVQVRPSGFFNRIQTNRPQMNVLNAAALIFISGGMNIAWSIGFRSRLYYNITTHVSVAWFIGAIIGAAISGFLPKFLPKRAITLFCSMLTIIGGIVNASTHYNINALTAALYMNGIANGLVFAPTLVVAGELAVFYMRGKICSSTEQLSFNFGIFLQILIHSTSSDSTCHYDGFNPDRISGILSAVFGFIGLCLAALLFIESPVALLDMGLEDHATDALRRLQHPFTFNGETYAQLAEHKLYVAENKQLSSEQSAVEACPAFVKLCILRVLNAMSISSFIYYALWLSTDDFYKENETRSTFLIFGACRLLGSFITSFLMDSIGRKKSTLLGLIVCGCLAIGIGNQYHFPDYKYVELLLDIFQAFAGVAFAASSAYLAEAYPLKVKQHFISFTFIVELVVFIVITSHDVVNEFFYVIGGIYIAVFLLSIWSLPETRRTTLLESQRRFRGCCGSKRP